MRQSALILTGLSTDGESGEYEYKYWRHHVGPLTVMGFSTANATAEGGEAVAMAYLSYLAHHGATARQLATKLAVRFVSDSPPGVLIDRLAAAYLVSDTAIRPVLQRLFTSPEFAASAGLKTRRPYEDLVAGLRAVGMQPPAEGTDGLNLLTWVAGELGQPPLGWHPPDGYPDVTAAWASPSGALARWNVHTAIGDRWYDEDLVQPDVMEWTVPLPATYGARGPVRLPHGDGEGLADHPQGHLRLLQQGAHRPARRQPRGAAVAHRTARQPAARQPRIRDPMRTAR